MKSPATEIDRSSWIERQACALMQARLGLLADPDAASYCVAQAEALWNELEARGYVRPLGPGRGEGER